MKQFKSKLLWGVIITVFIYGCGDKKPKNLLNTVELGNVKYAVPSKVKSKKLKNTQAIELLSQTNKVVGLAYTNNVINSSKRMSVSKRERVKSAKIVTQGIDKIYKGLKSDDTIDSVSLQSSQSFQKPYPFTVSDYRVMTDEPLSLNTLNERIMNYLDENVTGFSVSDTMDSNITDFRVVILYGMYENSDVYSVAVVPQSEYQLHKGLVNSIINAASYIPSAGSFKEATQSFTTGTARNQMDFLFVVDDSGSMSDDQDALSAAAEDFVSEMKNSGLKYRSSVITTSSGINDISDGRANRILKKVGIIENNETLLKNNLVIGTGGSATETGIYNAEQALQSKAKGNENDGSVTALGMPRENSDLSVIIISDERSQYRYRADGDFNVSNNLFIDRNITVYGIIENLSGYGDTTGNLDKYNKSQYDDLVDATGGIYADIKSEDASGSLDFRNIMQKIATDASGVASQFALKNWSTVIKTIKVNGKTILHDSVNGYTYSQASKSIVFHGTSVPNSNSSVKIEYYYYAY